MSPTSTFKPGYSPFQNNMYFFLPLTSALTSEQKVRFTREQQKSLSWQQIKSSLLTTYCNTMLDKEAGLKYNWDFCMIV